MRVISGKARGVVLKTPEGLQTRPTADRVKEALFSIIQFDLPGAVVLDLFGGTGQLGIEAISRGARRCVFVDSSRQSVNIVRENLEHCRLSDRARVLQSDALAYLAGCGEKFDIALLDPPYYAGLLEKILPALSGKMNVGGVIICETASDISLPEEAGDFTKRREYRYGRVVLTLYRHRSIESD